MLKRLLKLGSTALLGLAMASVAQAGGVTDKEIVLGTHLDLSGPVAAGMPHIRNGMQMRLDEVNEAGGINGRKLRLISEDDGYVPTRSVVLSSKGPLGLRPSALRCRRCSSSALPPVVAYSDTPMPAAGQPCMASNTCVLNPMKGSVTGCAQRTTAGRRPGAKLQSVYTFC